MASKRKPRAGKIKCSRCKTIFTREKGQKDKLCLGCQLHCYRCNAKLSPSTISLKRGLRKCIDCEQELATFNAKMKARDYQLVHTYGITYREYTTLCALQGNRCYVCLRPAGNISLAVDHEHVKGERNAHSYLIRYRVRGVMCYKCNKGLAFFRDDPVRFKRAAEYLLDPPAKQVIRRENNE